MSEDLLPRRSATGVAYWASPRKNAPWLVLIHGAFGSHTHWLPLKEQLSLEHSLLMLDMPGHGESAAVPAFRRLADAALHLRQVLDAAGVARAYVLGVSLGGMVAQKFARDYPDRLLGLLPCMCTPIFDFPMPAPRLLLAAARLQFVLTSWTNWCKRFAWQTSISPAVVARMETEVKVQSRSLRDAIWEAMICSVSSEPNFWFDMPVGQITAQQDTRFPGASAAIQRLSARIPATLRCELPSAGHCAWLEQPGAFADAAVTLLQRMRASSLN